MTSATLLLFGNGLLLTSLVTKYWSFYHLQVSFTGGSALKTFKNTTGHRGLVELCHEAHLEFIQGYEACIPRFTDFSHATDKSDPMSSFLSGFKLDYERKFVIICYELLSTMTI